jgi:hypothetical protein
VVFFSAVQNISPKNTLPTSAADHAYDALGRQGVQFALQLIPSSKLTAQDRAFNRRPEYPRLKLNALVQFRWLLDVLENDVLVSGPGINGAKCSITDIHAMSATKWALEELHIASERGFSKNELPKVHEWIARLPKHVQNKLAKISQEEAKENLLNSEYAAVEIGVDAKDLTG